MKEKFALTFPATVANVFFILERTSAFKLCARCRSHIPWLHRCFRSPTKISKKRGIRPLVPQLPLFPQECRLCFSFFCVYLPSRVCGSPLLALFITSLPLRQLGSPDINHFPKCVPGDFFSRHTSPLNSQPFFPPARPHRHLI